MSIDGRGSSPSRAAQDTISALKSERDRLKYERDEARRDRDAFAEEAAERTEERDRARRIAVELEQQLARVNQQVNRMVGIYEVGYADDPTEGKAFAYRAAQTFEHVVDLATDTLFNELTEGGAA
ncbi:hypothetical protein [Glycomyces sp. NPDC048151]|uniref:hypothetical protein n=1 Tax=Glycomyces sp. NPDC048151 TaxID=3364002 RepID=UPI00372123C6